MNKLKGSLWLVVLILTTISPLAYGSIGSDLSTAGDGNLVSSVEVNLNFPMGKEIFSEIEERIAKSIEEVARKVLVGQEVGVIKETRDDIIYIMKIVFDKVLWGYEVNNVSLIIDEKTIILVDLQPTSVIIEKVKVDVQIQGVSEKIIQVVNNELKFLQQQITDVMIGLPVDSLIWAKDVVKPILYHLIKWQIPGFEPTVELEIGSEIAVGLKLVPTGKVVEDIRIEINTQSLPRLLTKALEKRLKTELAIFHGLPLELLDKYQDKLVQTINDTVYRNGRNKYLYLNQKPEVVIGSTTELIIDVDWIDYKMDFIGELNIGLNAPGPALYISIGKRVGADTIMKLQNKVTLNRLPGTFSIGFEHNFGAGFVTKVDYNFSDSKIDAALDWYKGKFGITLGQTYPGDITNTRVALSYYPGPDTRLSLMHGNKNLWLSLQQRL